MKHLVCGLTFAAIALAQHSLSERPAVSECFKVHELLRADEEHYWATWTNTCPYTIDAVYVTVRFADRSSRDLADGVWSLHFVPPGAHRTMRFSAPGKVADFVSVHEKKITADMAEAFGREKSPAALSSVELAAVAAYRGAIVKEGSAARGMSVSAVVGDPGEVPRAASNEALLKDVLVNSAVARASTLVGDSGEASFRTDFPDAWQAVLSPQESAVSVAPRGSFIRFVSEDKPLFR